MIAAPVWQFGDTIRSSSKWINGSRIRSPATTAYTFSKFLADTISLTGSAGAVTTAKLLSSRSLPVPDGSNPHSHVQFRTTYIPYGGQNRTAGSTQNAGWMVARRLRCLCGAACRWRSSTANTLSYIFNGGLRPNLTGPLPCARPPVPADSIRTATGI